MQQRPASAAAVQGLFWQYEFETAVFTFWPAGHDDIAEQIALIVQQDPKKVFVVATAAYLELSLKLVLPQVTLVPRHFVLSSSQQVPSSVVVHAAPAQRKLA
jgi:hypothetical protein